MEARTAKPGPPPSDSASPSTAKAVSGQGPQRRYERYRWGGQVQLAWLDVPAPQSPVRLTAYDLSKAGAAIVSRRPKPMGARAAVLLVTPDGKEILRCFRVRHVRGLGAEHHLLGGEWTSLPDHVRVPVTHGSDGPRMERPFYAESGPA